MDNKKENIIVNIEYGMENLKYILDDILVEYIGDKEYAK